MPSQCRMKKMLFFVLLLSSCSTARLYRCPVTFDLNAEAQAFIAHVRLEFGEEVAKEAAKTTRRMSFKCVDVSVWPYGKTAGINHQPRASSIRINEDITFVETAASHEWAHDVRRSLGEPTWRTHEGEMYQRFSLIEARLRADSLQKTSGKK